MKKLFYILFLVLILTACGSAQDNTATKSKQASDSPSSGQESTEMNADSDSKDSGQSTTDSKSSDDNAETKANSALVGTWHGEVQNEGVPFDITLTLDSDGSFTYDEWNKNDDSQISLSGTYDDDATTLSLDSGVPTEETILPDNPVEFSYELNANNLKLTGEGLTLDLTKES